MNKMPSYCSLGMLLIGEMPVTYDVIGCDIHVVPGTAGAWLISMNE